MTSKSKSNEILLHAKLHRPGVSKDLVELPRLLELLDSGLDGSLTLVVAPAGFGKSTLVASWLQGLGGGDRAHKMPIPSAWLSLDESDSDFVTFQRYFVAAVRTIFPDACPDTYNMLYGRRQPPETLLFNTLSNEIEHLPNRFIMVLDDAHKLQLNSGMLKNLDGWIRHRPYPLHLVIISRRVPPVLLNELRVKGQLTEIRSLDLRFSPEESLAYLRKVVKVSSHEFLLSLVQERMEGWIAGLKLAAMQLVARGDRQALSTAFIAENLVLTDYLVDQVLNQQSPAMQRFLLKISILEQFNATLCEALIGDQDADCHVRDCLDQLEAAELFVTTLDDRREWYRFHDMFREWLQERLISVMERDQVNELHRRAATAYAGLDLPDQAIQHALRAGDVDHAAYLMQQGLNGILNREDRATLERWAQVVPPDLVSKSPHLLIIKAWDYEFKWDLPQVLTTVDQAEVLLDKGHDEIDPDQDQAMRGQIATLKGQAAFHANQPDRAIDLYHESLVRLPKQWHFARAAAGLYLGMSLYAAGRADEAEKYLTREYESAPDKTGGHALRILMSKVINYIQAGQFEFAERTAQTLLRQATLGNLPVLQGWGHYFLGYVKYQWNKLDAAKWHFTEVGKLSFSTQWITVRNGMIGQAFTSHALGKSADALEMIDRLSQYDLEYRGQEESDTSAARARLMSMQGDLEGAERWLAHYTEPPADQPLMPWFEAPQMTRAYLLIARNKTGDVQSALHILNILFGIAERTNNQRVRIEIHALRALGHLAQGDVHGARESLLQSVYLARRSGMVRVYVDLGPQMQKLLYQIAGHGPVSKSVANILAAFPGSVAAPNVGAPIYSLAKVAAISDPSFPDDDLGLKLTRRELELLTLMAEPISLREIADRVGISYTTVKRYTVIIYGKLDVHSRWDAVAKAVRMGIIHPR